MNIVKDWSGQVGVDLPGGFNTKWNKKKTQQAL